MLLTTLLMPMRNARPFVAAALRSVLSQEGVDLEVVVIDDGSTDGSADAVRALGDPRVRIIDGPRQGISAAMNAGIAAARATSSAVATPTTSTPPAGSPGRSRG